MKKSMKIICLLLATILTLSLTACSRSGSSAPAQTVAPWLNGNDTQVAAQTTGPAAAAVPGTEPIGTTEPQVTETEPVPVEPNYQIAYCSITNFESTFSEGRAWVRYFPETTTNTRQAVYGLIDESGHVYLTADEPGTPVSGGYTVLKRSDGYDICDLNGNCTFSSTDTPEKSASIVGNGDGVFAEIVHATSFSGNTYSLRFINGDGEDVLGFSYPLATDWSDRPTPSVLEYLGEGIFRGTKYISTFGHETILINIHTGEWIVFADPEDSLHITKISEFYEGEACVVLRTTRGPSYPDSYYYLNTITPEDLTDDASFLSWLDQTGPRGFTIWMYNPDVYCEGYAMLGTTARYTTDCWSRFDEGGEAISDYNGTDIAYFPTYPEGVVLKKRGVVSGGYIPLLLRGADYYSYVTMIDTAGNQVYEPVCLGKELQDGQYFSKTYELESFCRYANGNLFYKTDEFTGEKGFARIDLTGNVTFLPEIPTVFNNLYAIDDNYVYFDKCVTDYDGNIILDSVSYFVYEEEQPAVPESSGKTYQNLSSYSIEGKWKSVGSYGFGQAQPGAIVIFDGTHCNVYSPADTYAFYKSGDRFVLDCTSVLSGSVSFTVKIVDDDHIDLYQGGYITELTRVG